MYKSAKSAWSLLDSVKMIKSLRMLILNGETWLMVECGCVRRERGVGVGYSALSLNLAALP